jgi:hypothetical protein
VGKPAISYTPHTSATPEVEASVLSAVYSFVIKSSRAKRKTRGSNGSDNYARKERR